MKKIFFGMALVFVIDRLRYRETEDGRKLTFNLYLNPDKRSE